MDEPQSLNTEELEREQQPKQEEEEQEALQSQSQTQKTNKVKLQLGDIVEIDAPSDPDIHTKVYYVAFLNTKKIVLVENKGTSFTLLMDEEGKLNNESIVGIQILSRSEFAGYAKQNQLVTGKWVDVYFNGDIPFIVTGKITNLEEDMIEITTYPEKEVIYIDFGYKGLPEDMPLDKIILRAPPTELQIAELRADELVEGHVYENIPTSGADTTSASIASTSTNIASAKYELEASYAEEMGFEENVDFTSGQHVKELIKEMIFSADQIKFGEKVGEITQVIDVPLAEQRFGIEKQTQDLLDDLLSTIPNSQRTEVVLNNIHKMIERFKELRNLFSAFDEQGNALKPMKKGANYKPLIAALENCSQKLYWILPVVKSKKKLYNVIEQTEDENENAQGQAQAREEEEENVSNDYTANTLADVRIEEANILKRYEEGSFPDEENKYAFLNKALNPYFTPFENPENREKYLTSTLVNTDLQAVVDNEGDFYSSVVKSNVIKIGNAIDYSNNINRKRFLMQEYNVGMTNIEINKIRGAGDITQRKNLTPNDRITIKSFLTLPEVNVRFSRVNLPATNIFIKANLNRHYLNYWNFLKRNTHVNTKIIENLDTPFNHDETNFVNDIKEYVLDETITDDNKYKKYLDIIIPKTRVLFNLMKQYINDKLSVYEVLTYLEPFLIYQQDLSFMQYEEINNFIKEKITDIKKNYIKESRYFNSFPLSKKTFDLTRFLEILFSQFRYINKLLIDGYGFESISPQMTISEFMKKIKETDQGALFNLAVCMALNNLYLPNVETDKIVKSMNETLISSNEQYKKDNSECRQIKTLAKRYIALDELNEDNTTQTKEIYFDKMYDKTYYMLIEEYKDKLNPATASLKERQDFLKEALMKKNGLNAEDARREANAIILGKRVVEDGDYAVLILEDEAVGAANSETKMLYYERVKGQWKINGNVNEDYFIDINAKSLCNMVPECIYNTKNKVCDEMPMAETELKNRHLTQVLNEFEQNLKTDHEKMYQELAQQYDNAMFRIKSLKSINEKEKIKYDQQKQMLGNTAKENVVIYSPYIQLRDLILGQADLAKRQLDISKFVLNYTREAVHGEDKYWLYCIKTSTRLLPTFISVLAKTFLSGGNYRQMVELICTDQGKESDDGDAIVDKYSGYIIRKKNLEVSEEYSEEGFKMISHALLEADLGDSLTQPTNIKPEFENPDAEKISKVVRTMSGYMGINIESKHEFIIRNVIKGQSSTMPSKSDYEKAIQMASTKGKKTMDKFDSFEIAYDQSLMFLTLSYFLVAIQSSIPVIKTRKTHPGCVKSFMGFPMDGNEDTSGLNYVACVASKMEKRSIQPWNAIAKLKEKDIAKRMEAVISKIVMKNQEVTDALKEKQSYLLLNADKDLIPEEHSIVSWLNFLPPLRPFKMAALQNITKAFEEELLNVLRKGDKKQEEMISIIQGKMIFFSFGIQALIQKVVHSKTAILMNATAEPYLENACCDQGELNTIKYFIKEENEIASYNKIVEQLYALLDDIKHMGKASILFDPRNTKRTLIKLSADYSEETIYRAFIVYCKYNSDAPISDELKAICMNKPTNYNSSDSLNESIQKLKRDGKLYNNESLQQLLTIVNRKNMVNFKISKPLEYANVENLKDILKAYIDKDDYNTLPQLFITHFLSMLEGKKDDMNELFEDTKEMRAFKNYLGIINEKMEKQLIDFVSKSSKIPKDRKMNFIEQLKNIGTFKETGNNTFIESVDETLYKSMGFIKTAIKSITRVFPNMILNKVDYTNASMPNHWDLSVLHFSDIKKNLNAHYSTLYQFYEDEDMTIAMNKFISMTRDIELLIANTLFQTPLKIGEDKYIYSVFDRRLTKMLFQFYFNINLMALMSLKEDTDILLKTRTNPLSENLREADATLDEFQPITTEMDVGHVGALSELEIILGDKSVLSEKISELMVVFTNIVNIDKKVIDYNYTTLMERIMRSKEREKNVITENFKKMTHETREVQNLFKNYRLGDWNVGMQKGLVSYQKSTYDSERGNLDLMDAMMDTTIGEEEVGNDRNLLMMSDEGAGAGAGAAGAGAGGAAGGAGADNIEDMEATEITYMGEDADYEEMGLDGDEEY